MAKALERSISKAHTPTTSSTDNGAPPQDRVPPHGSGGDAGAEVCPRCAGAEWLRRDVAVGHPDFGRVFACSCIADREAERRLARLARASNFAALSRMTFDTFKVDAPGNSPAGKQSLRTGFEAAMGFAADPQGWLVLHGGLGCGKTHLAAAVVNERLRLGGSALFVVVPDLLDHLRAAFGDDGGDGLERRLAAVREAALLILDDLGAQAQTPWATEKLFQILNWRYNAGLPTVITTNAKLEALDERLHSRLGHIGFVQAVELQALDYRGGIDHARSELSRLDLYADKTFRSWDHRLGELSEEDAANVSRAYEAAREFAEKPAGWLVFQGSSGVGKTHLAAAVANYRVARGDQALLVVVPDLLDHLRATFGPRSHVTYDHRFEEVREAPLLVLDDLGTESGTPWAREKLFQVLNHRYVALLPTVITTSSNMAEVPPRLRTRMLDRSRSTVFAIIAPRYAGKKTSGRA